MIRRLGVVALTMVVGFSTPAQAARVDGDAVIGGALGAAAGAVVGSAIGGRDGAIIGGGLGGVMGAVVATSGREEERVVVVRDRYPHYPYYRHYDHGRHLGYGYYRPRYRCDYRYAHEEEGYRGHHHHYDDED